MKGNKAQPINMRWVIATGVLALAAIIAAFLPAASARAEVKPLANPEYQAVQLAEIPDATCLGCHGKPGLTTSLPGGDVLSISIDANIYTTSVHGSQGMSCSSCHQDITGYPHPEVTAQSRSEYSFEGSQGCQQCHQEQFDLVEDSIHKIAQEEGNPLAPACTDCHNPHTQTKLKDADGQILMEERVNIPVTCSKCHNEINLEYLDSVHGEGVLEDGNPDSPTCTDCHSVHNVGEVDNAFRLRSPQLCADCHTDEEMMSKYGLSTDVLSTYVADFHGTTVTLFEKTAPDQLTNTPVCIDCHGVHNILRTDDPEKGIQVKANLLKTCQRCHPDANENFPASWMSHYIASPTQAPLVYYVNLFYKILIPVLIGAMVIYVILDFIRRLIEKRKGVSHD